jgi:beta-glucanase (GH16 family)
VRHSVGTVGKLWLRRLARPILLAAVALAILGGASWVASGVGEPPVSPSTEAGWELVFHDAFDDPELAGSRWTGCYWWDRGGCTNKGNNELQWYRRGNASVAEGVLTIEARRERVSTSDGEFDFTSGLVSTGRTDREGPREDRFAFTYGFVEVRARLPKGAGLWPAIWLMPSSHESRPEIDIMEVLGHAPDVLEMHYHHRMSGEDLSEGQDRKVVDLSEDWHDFAVDWSPQAIVWYLDGKEQWRVDDPRIISKEPMYLIINLAVGGDWPGPPDEATKFPARLEIDHVRIWRRAPP